MQNKSHDRSDERAVYTEKTKSELIDELISVGRELRAFAGGRTRDEVAGVLGQSRAFQMLLNLVPAPVFFKDRAGLYLGCNQRFEDYIGRTRDEIVGHSVYDVAGPELAKVYQEADETLFREGGEQVYESQVANTEGDLYDVRFHKAVFELDDGSQGLIGVIFDITEAKQAQRQNIKLIDAFDALGEMVAVIDADERYLFCNEKYRWLNRDVVETLEPGMSFEAHLRAIAGKSLVPEAIGREEDWVRERMEQHRNPGEPFELERQDGIWMLVRTQQLPDGSVIILGTDITKLKQTDIALHEALAEAKNASRAKSEFLATMSYEFRTPLNAILGFSDVLRTQYFGELGSDAYVSYAQDIHKSGTHMLELVNDVLDVAAIEARKRPLVMEAIDLDELVGDSIRSVEDACRGRGIELARHMPADPPPVTTDARAITQILHNLLTNAVKFTDRGGRIDIRIEINESIVSFEVVDTGVGIPADKLPRITDPFVQADNNPLRANEGTGLGLSIVKTLAEMLDGSLDIESEVGSGTRVRVEVPLAPQQLTLDC